MLLFYFVYSYSDQHTSIFESTMAKESNIEKSANRNQNSAKNEHWFEYGDLGVNAVSAMDSLSSLPARLLEAPQHIVSHAVIEWFWAIVRGNTIDTVDMRATEDLRGIPVEDAFGRPEFEPLDPLHRLIKSVLNGAKETSDFVYFHC
jgi:hypothetical protein